MGRAQGSGAAGDQFGIFGVRRGSREEDPGLSARLLADIGSGELDGTIDKLVGAGPRVSSQPELARVRDALSDRLAERVWAKAERPLGGFSVHALQTLNCGAVAGPDEHQALGQEFADAGRRAVNAAVTALLATRELRVSCYEQAAETAFDRSVARLLAEKAKAGGERVLRAAVGEPGYQQERARVGHERLAELCPQAAWEDAFLARWRDSRATDGLSGNGVLFPWLCPAIRQAAGWQPDARRVVLMPQRESRESRVRHITVPDGPAGDAECARLLAAGGRLSAD